MKEPQKNTIASTSDNKKETKDNENKFKRKTREEYFDYHNLSIQLRKLQYDSIKKIEFQKPKKLIDLDTYNPYGKNFDENLQEIKIQNLKINEIHFKKYLILKIVSKILLLDSVNFICEDSNKEVINIAIYDAMKYYQTDNWDELENNIFAEGKYIIVIEPYYKMCDCSCGYDKLRIESMNEIILFNNKEDMEGFFDKIKMKIKTAETYEFLANLMIKNALNEKAILYFEKAVYEKKKENEVNFKFEDYFLLIKAFLNLSRSYFWFGYYTKSVMNADNCLNLINKLIKNDKYKKELDFLYELKLNPLTVKIKGLYGLRKYKDFYDIIHNKNYNEKDKEIIDKLLKQEKGFASFEGIEMTNIGKYIFEEMVLSEGDFEFWGDYLNPKLEIQFEKNKGIKFIAKENINLGELILVEKSLACQNDKEEDGRVNKSNLKDLNNKDVSMTEEDIDLFNELAPKLLKYPLDYEKFYYLYDGNNLNEDINQRKQYLKNQIDGKI